LKCTEDQDRRLQFNEVEDAIRTGAVMRSSSTPDATEGIGLDNGIESFVPFCKSKIAFPISRRTSSGKLFKTALAFGWKRAGLTDSMSQI